MDKNIVVGLALRHGLTTLGGWLASKGYIEASEVELGVGAVLTLVGIVWSIVEKHRRKAASVVSLSIVLAFAFVACAGQTPRQQFYMAEVAFSGAQSAAIAYLKTPYGQAAEEKVLSAISEASDEGTMTLQRLRPLVPDPGQEVPDFNLKLLDIGFETMDSVVERLNRTVFAPENYEEE